MAPSQEAPSSSPSGNSPPTPQPAPPPAPATTRPTQPAVPGTTRFYGSQIGGRSAINYGYTDMPWRLMAWDLYYFFYFIWALPYILCPMTPADSEDLSELSPTPANVWCIALHAVLILMQLAGVLTLPLLALLPVWAAAAAIGIFLLVNKALSMLLNKRQVEYHSDPKYAPALPEHAHEQWIYINGVATGSHWMQGNLNRLAVTFKRPILGIHNKTSGIIFDVIECLIQRNWGYATEDVRVCYKIIKEKIYNPQYTKVIFILHSQGGIEGGLILDWLLQELPQDLLSKLEVYTFGNAANHFNNPHRHNRSLTLASRDRVAASVDSIRLASVNPPTTVPRLRKPVPNNNNHNNQPSRSASSDSLSSASSSSSSSDFEPLARPTLFTATGAVTSSPTTTAAFQTLTATTSPHPSHLSGRAIGHIEHYAHTTDFVALWGVLHFATSCPASPAIPRFIGRVFARATPRGGHQMVQHYLDGMFPLRKDPETGGLLKQEGTDVPWGVDEEGVNEFMESEVLVGGGGDGTGRDWVDEGGEQWDGKEEKWDQVQVLGVSPTVERKGMVKREEMRIKVKELSRLWQYRNGRSPERCFGVEGLRGKTL